MDKKGEREKKKKKGTLQIKERSSNLDDNHNVEIWILILNKIKYKIK